MSERKYQRPAKSNKNSSERYDWIGKPNQMQWRLYHLLRQRGGAIYDFSDENGEKSASEVKALLSRMPYIDQEKVLDKLKTEWEKEQDVRILQISIGVQRFQLPEPPPTEKEVKAVEKAEALAKKAAKEAEEAAKAARKAKKLAERPMEMFDLGEFNKHEDKVKDY